MPGARMCIRGRTGRAMPAAPADGAGPGIFSRAAGLMALLENDKVIWRIAHDLAEQTGMEAEDLHGAGVLQVIKKLAHFRPEAGHLWGFIQAQARYGMLDAVRDRWRSRREGHAAVQFIELREIHQTAGRSNLDRLILAREAWEAVKALPARWQRLLALYYRGEATMRECGGALGVTESRASQIHKSAIQKLRAGMGVV